MLLTIGITDTEARYDNYPLWLKGEDASIAVIKLTPQNIDKLPTCDGIVLSGGVDTHPSFYNSERTDYPLAPAEFKIERDQFELSVFDFAKRNNVPIMAICRGMQLLNIAMGGDMIQDIEEVGKNNHRRMENKDGIHLIEVDENSMFYSITGCKSGEVNSAHHQALGKIAPELKAVAKSLDGIVESVEWTSAHAKPFLIAVQWHPERLVIEQPKNPFTKKLREQFLHASADFQKQKRNK